MKRVTVKFNILLGDSAFPQQTWLENLFGNTALSRKQTQFNYCMSRTRIVTEYAFSLKGEDDFFIGRVK